jgi:hypothetical protein
MTSIIQRASGVAPNTATLIFGEYASGKSTAALEAIDKTKEGLWVCFDNVSAAIPKNVLMATPSTWAEFEQQVLVPIRTGEASYKWVVLDGLNVALGLILNAANPTQQQWAEAGTRLRDVMVLLRSRTVLVATLAAVEKEIGAELKLALSLNPDSLNKLLPLFAQRWFCYTAPKRAEGKIVGVDYLIQKNGVMALRFTKG